VIPFANVHDKCVTVSKKDFMARYNLEDPKVKVPKDHFFCEYSFDPQKKVFTPLKISNEPRQDISHEREKGAKEPRDSKEPKETKEMKESKGTRGVKEPKETKEIKSSPSPKKRSALAQTSVKFSLDLTILPFRPKVES